MGRNVVGFLVCAVLVNLSIGELFACGDKFLRPGRSARSGGYAATYPAEILFYAPNATGRQLSQYQAALERGGHRTRAARSLDDMRAALAESSFDVVIVPLADTAPVMTSLAALASRPAVLPVIGNLSKAARAAAELEFPHTLKEGTTDVEAVDEIDHVMEARLGRRPSSPTR